MSPRRRRFLWITDPWLELAHRSDTSLRLALEAHLQGFQNYWADVRTIRLEGGRILLDAHRLVPSPATQMEPEGLIAARPEDFDSLQYRVDPPVNAAYLHPLQLLCLGLPGKKLERIVNPARVLFSVNEKTEGGTLQKLMPPSLVASEWDRLERFGLSHSRTVVKPLDQAQSKGVERLDWRTPSEIRHARQVLRAATEEFKRPVLLQRYLRGIRHGEKRCWFVDGRLLATAAKLPLPGDFRVNIDRGSRMSPASLTLAERAVAAKVARRLRQLEVRLAAVDLIEGYVTDFNVTSPGLICQMERVTGENLARPIIKALAR